MSNNPKKNILPLDLPVDIYGINPRAEEMVTEEVIGYLNNVNINTSLLSENDPLRDEYTKFLNDMGNSPIIITNEDIGFDDNKSYFEDVDFSKSTPKPEIYGLKITKDFYIHNNLWASNPFNSVSLPSCPNYIVPTQLNFGQINITKRKIMGEEITFSMQQYSFEPQQLTNINYMKLSKK